MWVIVALYSGLTGTSRRKCSHPNPMLPFTAKDVIKLQTLSWIICVEPKYNHMRAMGVVWRPTHRREGDEKTELKEIQPPHAKEC